MVEQNIAQLGVTTQFSFQKNCIYFNIGRFGLCVKWPCQLLEEVDGTPDKIGRYCSRGDNSPSRPVPEARQAVGTPPDVLPRGMSPRQHIFSRNQRVAPGASLSISCSLRGKECDWSLDFGGTALRTATLCNGKPSSLAWILGDPRIVHLLRGASAIEI